MTKSKQKKQRRMEREICNPEHVCMKCGKKLSNNHHFFCNDCYVPGLMYSEEIKSKIKQTVGGVVRKSEIK